MVVAEVDGEVVGLRRAAHDVGGPGRGPHGRGRPRLERPGDRRDGSSTPWSRRAKALGVTRLFCLTFETRFFTRHGFVEIEGTPVESDVYLQLLRSYDEGVAEFLDLERVKPNTLGNSPDAAHPGARTELRRARPGGALRARLGPALRHRAHHPATPCCPTPRSSTSAAPRWRACPPARSSTCCSASPTRPTSTPAVQVLPRARLRRGGQRPAEHTWLCRPAPGQRASTVDVVVHGSPDWSDRLRFRDLLRADAGLAPRAPRTRPSSPAETELVGLPRRAAAVRRAGPRRAA